MTTRRNPSAARRRILAAAAGEFAEHGYAGARVDRIATVARLNKRMLYHYFGDKQGLFLAVLENHLGGDVAPPGDRPPDPLAARLLLWALLEPVTAATARRRTGLEGSDAAVRARAWQWLGTAFEPPARLAAGKPRVRLKP